MSDLQIIRVVLPRPQVVRISILPSIAVPASASWGNITGTLSNQTDLQAALDDKVDKTPGATRPTTLNEVITLLHNSGLCALFILLFSLIPSSKAADFGDIPANLTMSAGKSVRRNAGNTDFEAYTPSTSSGTVTSFSSGNLSPLFTTSVTNPTTTPALSFTLSNSAAHTFFANNTGGTGAPSFTSFVAGTDYWDTTVFTGSSSIGLVPQVTGVPTCLRFLDENGSWTCASGGSSGGAPDNAHYLTSQAESGLTNEVNLGGLTTGLLKITVAGSVATPSSITDNSSNWDTAFTDRLKWDGGATGLTASTGRTSLGATTVGSNLFTLTNPSSVTFFRVNADNTVDALNASDFRSAIGAGTGGGDVSSNTSTSVDSEIALFNGTSGKSIKRATGSGIATVTSGVFGTITDNSSNWDTGFSERRQWDGGSTNLVAATGRTSLGGTTVGQNFFTLTNPSAITFPKIAADNSVTAESASTHRTSIGATTVGGNLFTLTNPSAITWARINADNTVTTRTASETRTDLSLVVGTNVQAWDTQLDSLAGLSYTSNALKVVRVNAGETGFELATAAGGTGADPTAKVGTSVVNGSASTFMRSDAAPPIDQTIDLAMTAAQSISLDNATTNTVDNLFTLNHTSTGTVAQLFGTGIKFGLESANGTLRDAAQIRAAWDVATDATRCGVIDFFTVKNGAALTRAARITQNQNLLVGGSASDFSTAGVISADTGFIIAASAAGNGKFLQGDAVKYTNSAYTIPLTAGSSGKIFISDGSNVISSTPTYPNSATSGGVLTGNGSNFTAEVPSATAVALNAGGWKEYSVTGSDVTRTAQTLADVTGLVTDTLSISSTYEFQAELNTASTSAAGNQYAVTCSVAPTRIMAIQIGATSATAADHASINASGTAMTATMTYSGDGFVEIHGYLTTAGSGSPVLSIQHLKVTSGTSTVRIGSTLRIRKK